MRLDCRILLVLVKLISSAPTAEYEFYQFKAPPNQEGSERNSSSTAAFLRSNPTDQLPSLTEGMFGYSLTRPVHNQEYYYGIFDTCEKFRCGIEGWHTESGPGVFEAVSSNGQIYGSTFLTCFDRHLNSARSARWRTGPRFSSTSSPLDQIVT